jgi:hypothetical protein
VIVVEIVVEPATYQFLKTAIESAADPERRYCGRTLPS